MLCIVSVCFGKWFYFLYENKNKNTLKMMLRFYFKLYLLMFVERLLWIWEKGELKTCVKLCYHSYKNGNNKTTLVVFYLLYKSYCHHFLFLFSFVNICKTNAVYEMFSFSCFERCAEAFTKHLKKKKKRTLEIKIKHHQFPIIFRIFQPLWQIAP